MTMRKGLTITVVGGLIVWAITDPGGYGVRAVTWIIALFAKAWHLLMSTVSVYGWILLLLGMLALIPVVSFCKFVLTRDPEHLEYTEDHMFGALWRWNWGPRGISDLRCFCPGCQTRLVYHTSNMSPWDAAPKIQTKFICEHCGDSAVATIQGERGYALGVVRREIERRITAGEYRAASSQSETK